MKENLGDKLTEAEYAEVQDAILHQEAMPSMRLLQFAGKAARATNVARVQLLVHRAAEAGGLRRDHVHLDVRHRRRIFRGEPERAEASADQTAVTAERKIKTHVVEDSKEGWCGRAHARLAARGSTARTSSLIFRSSAPPARA